MTAQQSIGPFQWVTAQLRSAANALPEQYIGSLPAAPELVELKQRYHQSKDPIQRSHYQILWLLAQGKTTQEVAAVKGYSRSWIYELGGYNHDGASSLGRWTISGLRPRTDQK
jgi:hypothetical protein